MKITAGKFFVFLSVFLSVFAVGLAFSVHRDVEDIKTPPDPSSGMKGAAGASLLGVQPFTTTGVVLNTACDKVYIAPGGSCVVPKGCYLQPPLVQGQHTDVAGLAMFDFAGDASGIGGCDSGNCIADYRFWFPGVLQGGSFCRGDGVCLAEPVDSFTPSAEAGLTFGDIASLVYLSDAGTVGIQFCSGAYSAFASGGVASQYSLPGGNIPDSGPVDSGPDTGPPDTGTALPLITSTQVNLVQAPGGDHFTECCYSCSGTTLSDGGASPAVAFLQPDAAFIAMATGCTYTSTTTGCVGLLPDGGSPNGQVTCTTPAFPGDGGGYATFYADGGVSGALPLIVQLESTNGVWDTPGAIPTLTDGGQGQDNVDMFIVAPYAFSLSSDAPLATIPSGATWNDTSSAAVDYAQSTGGDQPTVTVNWEGTGYPAILGSISGTVYQATVSTTPYLEFMSMCMTGNFTNVSGTQVVYEIGFGGTSAQYFIVDGAGWGIGGTGGGSGAVAGSPDTNMHLFCGYYGGSVADFFLDTVLTGGPGTIAANSASGSGTNYLFNNSAFSVGAAFNMRKFVVTPAYAPTDPRFLLLESAMKVTGL
jgi:hypothetical protein